MQYQKPEMMYDINVDYLNSFISDIYFSIISLFNKKTLFLFNTHSDQQ